MKKLLLMMALVGFPAVVLTGCGGGGEPAVVEETSDSDGTAMTATQQADYEKQMTSGGSSRPGN